MSTYTENLKDPRYDGLRKVPHFSPAESWQLSENIRLFIINYQKGK